MYASNINCICTILLDFHIYGYIFFFIIGNYSYIGKITI